MICAPCSVKESCQFFSDFGDVAIIVPVGCNILLLTGSFPLPSRTMRSGWVNCSGDRFFGLAVRDGSSDIAVPLPIRIPSTHAL